MLTGQEQEQHCLTQHNLSQSPTATRHQSAVLAACKAAFLTSLLEVLFRGARAPCAKLVPLSHSSAVAASGGAFCGGRLGARLDFCFRKKPKLDT